MDMFTQLELISERNSYIKNCSEDALLRYYFKIAEIHLSNRELERAKQCFEKAASHGSKEAEAQLRRFKINIFGKLKYN